VCDNIITIIPLVQNSAQRIENVAAHDKKSISGSPPLSPGHGPPPLGPHPNVPYILILTIVVHSHFSS